MSKVLINMTKETAKAKANSYLDYISDCSREKLHAYYRNPFTRALHKLFTWLDYGTKFEIRISPTRYDKIPVYDATTNFMIDNQAVYENEYAWGFGWDSEAFLTTQDRKHGIYGNGLVIVDKANSKLYQSPTFRGYDFMFDDFTKYKTQEEYQVSWEFMERAEEAGKWAVPRPNK